MGPEGWGGKGRGGERWKEKAEGCWVREGGGDERKVGGGGQGWGEREERSEGGWEERGAKGGRRVRVANVSCLFVCLCVFECVLDVRA